MNWWTFMIVAIVSSSTKITTAEAKPKIKREECINGQLTLHYEADRDGKAVRDIEWKIKFPGIPWIKISSCTYKSGGVINCKEHRTMLADGFTLLNNSNGAVTIARNARNATFDHALISCQVHYFGHSVQPSQSVHEVNFTTRCVRIQEGHDLNLTNILINLLPCKRVVDIEWYNINRSRFAYCNACQNCKVTKDSNHPVPVFWNRLQVTSGSLALTGIQNSDNNREITVQVHLKSSSQFAKRDINTKMEEPRVYTIRILVNSGHDSPVLKILLPIAPPRIRTDKPSLPSSWYTRSPKMSRGPTANVQVWKVFAMALTVHLGIAFAK